MGTKRPIIHISCFDPRMPKAGRLFLFILALVAGVTAPIPAGADTLIMDNNTIRNGVNVLSETKESMTVRLDNNSVRELPRSRIKMLLKNGMRVYVYKRDGTDVTALFKCEDKSGITFTGGNNGTGDFTVKTSDIFLLSLMTPQEYKEKYKNNPPPEATPDTISLISLVGFFQGIFLVFMLLRRKGGNRRANRVLALFITAASINLALGIFCTYLYAFHSEIILNTLRWIACFLCGPLIFFYVLVLVKPRFRLSLKQSLHMLPALFTASYLLMIYLMMNSGQRALMFSYKSVCINQNSLEHFLPTAFSIQLLIYIILSLRFVARHSRRANNLFSSTEKINLNWLSYLLRFAAVICVLAIVFYTQFLIGKALDLRYYNFFYTFTEILNTSLILLIGLMFFAIGYRGLVQPEIFAGIPDDLVNEPEGADQKISISPEKAREIMDRVIKVMEEERPYLDPKLTLPMLADMADVQRNILSRVINESTGQNFYDFINFYRVEEVKERMKDPAACGMNLLHIAFDAGFNAKATFNAVFKKNTNLTPTEYRKSILEN